MKMSEEVLLVGGQVLYKREAGKGYIRFESDKGEVVSIAQTPKISYIWNHKDESLSVPLSCYQRK
jgi:hypothetical protein